MATEIKRVQAPQKCPRR